MSQMGSLSSSGGSGTVISLTGNSGGAVSPDSDGNINVIGSGAVDVVGDPGTNTLTISVTGFFAWNQVTTSTAMAVNNGYITNGGSLVTLTLPATAIIGATVRVAGQSASLWKIAQNSGQTIHFGVDNTTTGTTGFLEATAQYDCVELVCIATNTDWVVVSSIGNITVF